MKTSWKWIAAVFVCIAVVAGATLLRDQDKVPVAGPDIKVSDSEPSAEEVLARSKSLSDVLGLDESEMVTVGDVERPKRDLYTLEIDQDKERKRYLASLPKMGRAPSIAKDANDRAGQLFKELNSEKSKGSISPARSPFGKVKAFDLAEYTKDPGSYLRLTRPGRVFQAKAPAEEVAPLESSSPMFLEILQGESTFLEVKAEPGMPVTFHTQQLGEFDNRLKTISVAANDEGLAKVKYKAVSGVEGSVRIMAASPVHSGRLVYYVDVSIAN